MTISTMRVVQMGAHGPVGDTFRVQIVDVADADPVKVTGGPLEYVIPRLDAEMPCRLIIGVLPNTEEVPDGDDQ